MHEDLCPVRTMLDTDRVHQLADHDQPASTQLRLSGLRLLPGAVVAHAQLHLAVIEESLDLEQLAPRLLRMLDGICAGLRAGKLDLVHDLCAKAGGFEPTPKIATCEAHHRPDAS